MAKIRVLLADDHEIARTGTAVLLATQPDFEVVGLAEDGAGAIKMFRQLAPDVLLVDLRMPAFDGVSVTATLCNETPGARILLLSHYDGAEDIFRALKAGARGYLTKDTRGQALIAAIRTVAAGGKYFPPGVAERMAEHMLQPALTPREQQVLEQIFLGNTNREIAASLAIAERTVGLHVANLFEKLGAGTRTECVAIALKRGLLQSR